MWTNKGSADSAIKLQCSVVNHTLTHFPYEQPLPHFPYLFPSLYFPMISLFIFYLIYLPNCHNDQYCHDYHCYAVHPHPIVLVRAPAAGMGAEFECGGHIRHRDGSTFLLLPPSEVTQDSGLPDTGRQDHTLSLFELVLVTEHSCTMLCFLSIVIRLLQSYLSYIVSLTTGCT